MITHEDAAKRFWPRINKTEGCWNWTGGRGGNVALKVGGYGMIFAKVNGKKTMLPTHRVTYELCIGPIPDGLYVLHRCDNRICCNPDHLFLGTHLDNMKDKVEKRRHCRGESHGQSKLTEDHVREIRKLHNEGWTQTRIATKFNITRSHVSRIANRKEWPHII